MGKQVKTIQKKDFRKKLTIDFIYNLVNNLHNIYNIILYIT